MSLTIRGLLAFLSRTFADFGPPGSPSWTAEVLVVLVFRTGTDSSRVVSILCDFTSTTTTSDRKVVSKDSWPFFVTFHDVQPRSPTMSSTHRPNPNIDDNQDLLTTSLDRGRPRTGKATCFDLLGFLIKSLVWLLFLLTT